MTKTAIKTRLKVHLSPTKLEMQKNAAKVKWILMLKSINAKPIVDIIQTFDNYTDAVQFECDYTIKMRSTGATIFNKYNGNKLDEITKRHLSLSKSGKPVSPDTIKGATEKRKKPVYQYSKDMKLINCWEFIINAANSLKIDRGDISKCCKDNKKTAGGFIWKYATIDQYLNYQQNKQPLHYKKA